MKKREKPLNEDLNKAAGNFFVVFAESIGIHKIVKWLDKILKHF